MYGADIGGNSRTRQALHDSLSQFVREKVNAGKSGEFMMDSRLYGDGQPGLVNLKAMWNEATLQKGLIKYHDSSLKEWITELGSREKKVKSWREEIEKVKEYLGNNKHSSWKISFLDEELFPSVEKSKFGYDVTPEAVETAEKKLARTEAEIKSFKAKIRNLNNPEMAAKGYYRELRKTSPDSLPDPQMILNAAHAPDNVARAAAVHAAIIEGDITLLSKFLAEQPLQERLDAARNIAQLSGSTYSTTYNSVDNAPIAKLWKDYAQSLPTPEERVAEGKKVVGSYDSNHTLLQAGIDVILSDIMQLKTPKERIKVAKLITNRQHETNTTLANLIATDIPKLATPRERMDAANIVLKMTGDFHVKTMIVKIPVLEAAHRDIDVLPTPKNKIDFAMNIIDSVGRSSEDMEEIPERSKIWRFLKWKNKPQEISDQALQHAKDVLVKNIPIDYEGSSDHDPLKNLTDRLKHCRIYDDDKTFAKQLDAAVAQHEQVLTSVKAIKDIVTATDDEQRAKVQKWAKAVRKLPNADMRFAAVMYAINDTRKAKREAIMAGEENPLKLLDAEVANFLIEIIPKLPKGMAKSTALATAVAVTADPAIKTELEHQFIAAVSDPQNNLSPDERITLFKEKTMEEGAIDFARPVVQAGAKLSLHYIDELEDDPKARAQEASMVAMMAKPGSDLERLSAIKFRECLEQLPVEERRIAAHEVSQLVAMVRDHPKNITAEQHGGALLEQAKAVLEGQPYNPEKSVKKEPKHTETKKENPHKEPHGNPSNMRGNAESLGRLDEEAAPEVAQAARDIAQERNRASAKE